MKSILLGLVCLSLSAHSKIEKLTLDTVLSSSLHHYPLIVQSLQNVEAAKMKVQAAAGAFDLKLKAKGDKRFKGYYDGSSIDYTLEKPFPFMNGKIYAGYRVSDGKYPTYEEKVKTLDEGETRIGLALSLWRDRAIDPRRFQLELNKLKLNTFELEVLNSKIEVQQEASKAYWKWVSSGNIYEVYKELYQIALKRQNNLKKRIKKGDLARIYQTENQQYIVKRMSQVIDSLQKYQKASLYLSLFIRDKEGNPLLPSDAMRPLKMSGERKIAFDTMMVTQSNVMKNSPELLTISNKIEALRFEEKIGANKLKPKFDLSFEVSKDRGEGADSLDETENRAFLKVEIPIERRAGRGKMLEARFKRKGLMQKRKLLIEKMKVSMQNNLIQLNASVDKITNTNQEVELAQILQGAEVKKFNRGASDFFVVNLREQNTADAKVKNIKAHLEYKLTFANYQAISLALIQ